jgi:hypothetical protein
MKPLSSILRRLLPMLGVAAIAAVLPSAAQAQAQQNVIVNGSTVCTGSGPSMSIDPAGNLNITCTPAGGGGGTPTVPSCVVPTVIVTQGAASATLTASCSGSPTSYAWTAGTSPSLGGPATSQSFSVGPFPNLGSFTYTVVATNSVGDSAPATGTVSVVAPGTCTASSVTGVWPDGFQQPLVAIPKLGSASYQLPPLTVSGRKYTISSVQSLANTAGPNPLPLEIAISSCPGDFSSAAVLPNCAKYGPADTGGVQLPSYAGVAPKGTYCTIPLGNTKTYYVNIRAVDTSNNYVCRGNTCYMIVTFQPGS